MNIYLPNEIWWSVLGYLDFISLVKLRCTNKYFNDLIGYKMSIGDISLRRTYIPNKFNRLLMRLANSSLDSNYILACRYFNACQYVSAWQHFNKHFELGGNTFAWMDKEIVILNTSMYYSYNDDLILIILYVHTRKCKHLRLVAVEQNSQYEIILSQYDMRMIKQLVKHVFPKYDIGNMFIIATGCKSYRIEYSSEFSLSIEGWTFPTIPDENHPFMI